ncbi:MAG: enterocin 1071A family bacteriocin [Miniphocaeibacter sp.]|uniref:enterocin 1071A family bacteriocin n=1 Tax=Miniphocaeibacter sp. TaxID=3100973 RepID=UPI0017E628E1|nr:hypothetical protein [Gallicola sp.]
MSKVKNKRKRTSSLVLLCLIITIMFSTSSLYQGENIYGKYGEKVGKAIYWFGKGLGKMGEDLGNGYYPGITTNH